MDHVASCIYLRLKLPKITHKIALEPEHKAHLLKSCSFVRVHPPYPNLERERSGLSNYGKIKWGSYYAITSNWIRKIRNANHLRSAIWLCTKKCLGLQNTLRKQRPRAWTFIGRSQWFLDCTKENSVRTILSTYYALKWNLQGNNRVCKIDLWTQAFCCVRMCASHQISNPCSTADNTRTWVHWTKPLRQNTPTCLCPMMTLSMFEWNWIISHFVYSNLTLEWFKRWTEIKVEWNSPKWHLVFFFTEGTARWTAKHGVRCVQSLISVVFPPMWTCFFPDHGFSDHRGFSIHFVSIQER